jgi:hypothetical protein
MLVGPDGFATGEHIHPCQSERFAVVKGQLTLRVDGQGGVYKKGSGTRFRPALRTSGGTTARTTCA